MFERSIVLFIHKMLDDFVLGLGGMSSQLFGMTVEYCQDCRIDSTFDSPPFSAQVWLKVEKSHIFVHVEAQIFWMLKVDNIQN